MIGITFLVKAQDLVPLPVEMIGQEGSFVFTKESRIVLSPGAEETANYLASILRKAIKYPFVTATAAQKRSGDLLLELLHNPAELPQEGYRLTIDAENVTISAVETAGLFYGVQTLLQLLPPTVYSGQTTGWEGWNLPALTIKDYPRFGYRGMMLDVSRQFYDVATVKKYLDWMAMHKLNVLHWHLTDDNGWRIEIKKYPKLTQLGAWRGPDEVLPPSYGSGNRRYGGFYTQKEIKEVVAYAQKLHIHIIPEVDLPGHGKAAAASYPEILCQSNDVSMSVNGENLNLWCVGREANYKMLENIMAEIAQLFPWDYIHIGGDEVNPGPWSSCPHCQALMKKEGMTDVMELQAYFVKRMEQIVAKCGKKMIGWDEVIDHGSTDRQTAVTAWRSVERGLNAIRGGHPTIMQPSVYAYLDMKQTAEEWGHNWAAIISLERVYSFDPTAGASLTPKESELLLGVQAGLWGELLDRPPRIPEYQLFPRLCALAEVGWTPQERRVWEDFEARINRSHFDRLYEMGIAFRFPPPQVRYTNGMLVVTPPFPWAVVRFAADDRDPDLHDSVSHYPLITNEPWKYRFASFYRDKYRSPVIAGAPKAYQKPVTTVELSFPLRPRNVESSLTDYDPNTYIRSGRTLIAGDYVIYRFTDPLECRKINVVTGIPHIPIYYVEDGEVLYSMNGEDFIPAGTLVYGNLSFTPPKGVKAVKILMGAGNYALQTAFMDLQIE